MKTSTTICCLTAFLGLSLLARADEPALCLDCHEPAEDWVDMSAQEILAEAKNAKIKRHADNQDLSDEELAAIIATLLKK